MQHMYHIRGHVYSRTSPTVFFLHTSNLHTARDRHKFSKTGITRDIQNNHKQNNRKEAHGSQNDIITVPIYLWPLHMYIDAATIT